MSRVLSAVERFAESGPDRIAFEDFSGQRSLSYRNLAESVAEVSERLKACGAERVALLADNGITWAVMDLACLRASVQLVPVPHFFSPTQISHLLHAAGIDTLYTDHPDKLVALCDQAGVAHRSPQAFEVAGMSLSLIRLDIQPVALPNDCAKVTFTSGSTGDPKGVCLSRTAMESVASSLADVTDAVAEDRHLSLLPYATLLENIGGLYAPLLAGATVCVSSLSALGWSGAAGLDVQQFITALHTARATTCIMIPQMLHALVAALEGGAPKPESLRYVAVGGAPVSEHLLARARVLGLPVYEGYGLSEASSVVAVNRTCDNRPGSVGKLLPHVSVEFADDGEILVAGALFSGYLGDAPLKHEFWPTGDIGYMDDDGFLYLNGRKKHIFITAYGRNVSPEWVERELSIEPAIAQCCVFGEARPFNVAIILPRDNAPGQLIEQAIASANSRLPDYARISRWLPADEAFTVENGLWTGTGRPRRQHICDAYADKLAQLYEER